MKVLVLGSGVIGVTHAYYLAKAGHSVTVVDRQPGPALETSYANAGQISPGYSAPWAAPGIPVKAMKWLAQRHAPLKLHPQMDTTMWKWMMQMLSNCTESAYAVNKERMMRLAEYSRDCFIQLRKDTGIQYNDRQQGTLQLFRTDKQVKASQSDIAVLERCNVPYEVLSMDQCIAIEPALERVREKFISGLRLPGDETGDCFEFTSKLVEISKQMGVEYLFDTTVNKLLSRGGNIIGVDTSAGELTADIYVVAMGSYTPFLVNPLGLELPIYPVKGYSLTVPITNADAAPVSTVMDETYKVAITRFEDRIRVAGTAELSGYNLKLREPRRETIAMVVRDVFPDGGDVDKAEFWTGLRPMTPDGTPLVGKTQISNLYLNSGHGTLGWTMSCGSGKLLADVISGKQPDIDPAGLDVSRYS
ncbi:D-amino acid dehydrogenase [Pokkaliibacter sp. MBI-7]|uniref:D-amino acid dehydrogenase n=1 Tax=Pokkaliibacter sp. MBI-7 TaxID=3040600 RepID=UPI00244C3DCB|nr:D-amino acid dehydrogenase [Pokkaliibacter sp. MBI-7]MDH2431600.1 D-amino acid dehydrogenase [Pokkaliibacter sp. MBI-7]